MHEEKNKLLFLADFKDELLQLGENISNNIDQNLHCNEEFSVEPVLVTAKAFRITLSLKV